MKCFKVAAASVNVNGFGLRGMVLIAQDGEAWSVAANELHVRNKGDEIRVPLDDNLRPQWGRLHYEIPQRMSPAPVEVVNDVWA
jgi:hypothetical protein